jgi:hypothetical protein
LTSFIEKSELLGTNTQSIKDHITTIIRNRKFNRRRVKYNVWFDV